MPKLIDSVRIVVSKTLFLSQKDEHLAFDYALGILCSVIWLVASAMAAERPMTLRQAAKVLLVVGIGAVCLIPIRIKRIVLVGALWLIAIKWLIGAFEIKSLPAGLVAVIFAVLGYLIAISGDTQNTEPHGGRPIGPAE